MQSRVRIMKQIAYLCISHKNIYFFCQNSLFLKKYNQNQILRKKIDYMVGASSFTIFDWLFLIESTRVLKKRTTRSEFCH